MFSPPASADANGCWSHSEDSPHAPTAGSLSWARAFGGSAAAGREISDRVSAMGFQEVGIDPDCWLFPSSGDHMVTNRR